MNYCSFFGIYLFVKTRSLYVHMSCLSRIITFANTATIFRLTFNPAACKNKKILINVDIHVLMHTSSIPNWQMLL